MRKTISLVALSGLLTGAVTEVPFGMDSGWSSWEDAMRDRARDMTQ